MENKSFVTIFVTHFLAHILFFFFFLRFCLQVQNLLSQFIFITLFWCHFVFCFASNVSVKLLVYLPKFLCCTKYRFQAHANTIRACNNRMISTIIKNNYCSQFSAIVSVVTRKSVTCPRRKSTKVLEHKFFFFVGPHVRCTQMKVTTSFSFTTFVLTINMCCWFIAVSSDSV